MGTLTAASYPLAAAPGPEPLANPRSAPAPVRAAATASAIASPTPAPAPKPKPKRLPKSPLPWTYRTSGRKLILIDRSSQWVGLYGRDGKRVAIFRCASGTLYPTVGWHHIYSKQRYSSSLTGTVSMQYFCGFQRSARGNNVGFHSIPVTPSGHLISGLGKPVSHGCVRLALSAARQLYRWAPIGTKVYVRP